uniref:Sorting nexin/Vps5-like C-terminal domain-containing protein n=1 Tax=Trichobilharzia regenti TaxID=157069 RepID=A0AA85IRR7_TRIRE|nr:unnamed protein product [Trichobilharzia regenti]
MQKEKKNYAVLRKPGSQELFIAARSWMLSEDLCLYHSSVTDNEVEACVRPRPEWVLTDCQMLAELDSFVEAKNTLQATKRIHSVLSNSDNLEDTLPLTNSKRQRVETKNSSYAYNSLELEAVEAQKVCLPSKYPSINFMETVVTDSQFFYQKADELDTWEKQLKRLYSSLLALVSGDNDLANAKVGLSRSILLLANVEENTGLAQALHQLADTEGHVAELHALQAEAHTCHLAEYTREVLGMVQACKKSECRSPVFSCDPYVNFINKCIHD